MAAREVHMARWAVVTGERGHNKADFVMGVAEELRAAGVRVAGYVQRRRHDGAEKGHDLQRLSTGERILLSQDGWRPRASADPSHLRFHVDAFAGVRVAAPGRTGAQVWC
jgi:nucleoside-triphosphatase THEP1